MNIKAPSNWCVTSQPNLGDSEEAPQAPGNSRLNPIIPHSLQPSAQDRGFQSALILYDPQLSYDDNFWVLVCLRPVTRKQLAQIKLSFKWETCWLLVPSETWYSSDSLTVENMWLRWGERLNCVLLCDLFSVTTDVAPSIILQSDHLVIIIFSS